MIDVETLSCQELVELVTDYLDGALGTVDLARFEQHLAGCGKCAEYLAQLRQAIRITGTMTPDDLTAEMEEALLQAFRDWRRR